jgi:hypothetical protein
MFAQTPATLSGTPSVNTDDRVLKAPYSAQRRFTYVKKSADGTTNRTETSGSKARDSEGRSYSADERLWTYSGVPKSEMLYKIKDPVAKTDTSWDSSSKEVKVLHWHQSTQERDVSEALRAWTMPHSAIEKLGVKTIGGFVAEGTRNSYTVPAGQGHNDQPIVVVHESWYCPELKIVILETNDDPRSGTSTDELVDIVRGEPNVTKYLPPADYVVRDIQLP